jgi:hypothetical protein
VGLLPIVYPMCMQSLYFFFVLYPGSILLHECNSQTNFNYALCLTLTSAKTYVMLLLQLKGPILISSIRKQLIWIRSRLLVTIYKFTFDFSILLIINLCSILIYEIFAILSVLPFLRRTMRWRMLILLLHQQATLM